MTRLIRFDSRIFVICLLAAGMLACAGNVQAASGTWTQLTSGGLWSAGGNWSGGTIADGSGFTADFSTIDITADNTVHLDSARTITTLIFGDTVTNSAASWVLDNNSTPANILTLAATPTITVNALGTGKSATISAVIAGTSGTLTIAGSGTLTLSGSDTYPSTITVGTTASVTTTLNIQNNLTIGTGGAGQFNLGGAAGATGIVYQTSGTVDNTGGGVGIIVGQAVSGIGIYNLSGGTMTPLASPTLGVTMCQNNSATGTFNLSGTGNLNAGSSTVNIGRWNVTTVTPSTPTYNQTGGTATIGTLYLGGKGASCAATLNLTGGTFTVTTFGGILGQANKSSTLAMTIGGTATATLPAFPVKTTGNTATFTFDGGTLVIGAASASYMQATCFDTATITANGGTIKADSGNDATIAQVFGGVGGLTKSGTGTLTLSGANTYSGGTIISNGTLAVTGSGTLGGGDVTVSTNATLSLSTSSAISDTNRLTIATGAFVTLGGGVNETVKELYFGTTPASAGTWGASGSGSGNTNDVFFSGTGILTVTQGGVLAAAFSASKTNGLAPLAVTFTDTSTGTITNRFWNFGDGNTSNTTATTVQHTFSLGTWNVQLIVSDPSSSSTSTVTTITGSTTSTIAVLNGSFETIGSWTDGTWARFGSPWSPSGGTYMQEKAVSGGAFTSIPDGLWIANLNAVNVGTPLIQDLGTSVSTGNRLSVTFRVGREKTGGGGQGVSYFKVNTTLYPMAFDISSLAADSWQSYTMTQTITNSGNLSLGFYGNSGSGSNCWLDLISDVTETAPPASGCVLFMFF